jgi:hypothetical protein
MIVLIKGGNMLILTTDPKTGRALAELFKFDGFDCQLHTSRGAAMKALGSALPPKFAIIDESAWEWFNPEEKNHIKLRTVVTLLVTKIKKKLSVHHMCKKPVNLDELLIITKLYCRVTA